MGEIAFSPHRIDLGTLPAGEHRLDLTAFGNRQNAFGAMHHTNVNLRWVGPDAWRSQGDDWCDEYQLRPCGILTAPRVLAPRMPGEAHGHRPIHQ